MGAKVATKVRLSDGAVQSILNLVAIALERIRMEQAAKPGGDRQEKRRV